MLSKFDMIKHNSIHSNYVDRDTLYTEIFRELIFGAIQRFRCRVALLNSRVEQIVGPTGTCPLRMLKCCLITIRQLKRVVPREYTSFSPLTNCKGRKAFYYYTHFSKMDLQH